MSDTHGETDEARPLPLVRLDGRCPRDHGDLLYSVERGLYCCVLCNYSQVHLIPTAEELRAAGLPTVRPAVRAPTSEGPFTLLELTTRWHISEQGVRLRLMKYGGLERVGRDIPVPASAVAKVEQHVAGWGDQRRYPTRTPAASQPTEKPTEAALPEVETPRNGAVKPETALVVSHRGPVLQAEVTPVAPPKSLRLQRMRVALERIRDRAWTPNSATQALTAIQELAAYTLQADALEDNA